MTNESEIQDLLAQGVSYGDIADRLGMMKSNVAKAAAQEKMRRGEILGHLDPVMMRRCYIDEAIPIELLAKDAGCSVIQLRRWFQAHEIHRDRGAIYRAGTKLKARKGERVPGSKRDPNSKARAGSYGHREKLAAAKRGKTGPAANRWKGGHEIGGYAGAGGGKNKTYEHRQIASNVLGRELSRDEHVHHIDKNRKNNELSNLLVLSSVDHSHLHVAMRKQHGLDQRQWLLEQNVSFEDLQNHA